MSRIFMIGDTHLGLGYPNKYDKWNNIHKEYFNNFLIPLLKKEIKEGDIIIHMGDLFDNRSVIPLDLLSYTQKLLELLSNLAPLHIIVGNHDLYTKSTSDINSINLFKYIPNVFIYEETTILKYNGNNLLLMPYIENKNDQIEQLKKYNDCDYLFCHSDLNGCRMHLTSVANKNKDKIDIEEFSSFKRVFSGHIHLTQVNKNFIFVGSIFQMDRNDYLNKKGIFTLDTNNGNETFIENNLSPQFDKLIIKEESDILLFNSINPNNFIDLFISNSLITTNKKLRKSIESYLINSTFESVDYIDDLSEKVEESIKSIDDLVESDLELTVKLDYKDIISDYILKIKWENDHIKNKMIDTFNEIIELYEIK